MSSSFVCFLGGVFAAFAACLGFLPTALHAQTMPREMPQENLVDVPAISEHLCVSNLFQTNMVLQRDKPIHVWGWAEPGEQVTVSFGGDQGSATAGANRDWRVTLPARPASHQPQTMTIRGNDRSVVLENILMGDVWLLGGQSNMEFELDKVENGELEIVSANFPEIRILTVPYGQGPDPQMGFARLHEWSDWFGRHFRKGDWDVCSPQVVRDLSAIGYVFARRIHMASRVPIGVIDVSRGGTTVETWTPLAVLRGIDSEPTRVRLAQFDQEVENWNAQADLEDRIAQHRQWLKQQAQEGKPIPAEQQQEPRDLRPGPIGDHNFPGHCYAGMIAPLAGLSVKGAIFHQGYNNAFDGSRGAAMYRDVFPEMIEAWRDAFQDLDMPFGIISLCTEGYPQTRNDYCERMFNAGIEIREAHYLTFLKFYRAGDKNIGYASSYDLRRRWYHPQLKIPAGERIARWALATQYGFSRELEWKPPMLVSMEAQDGLIRLTLDMEVGDPEENAIEGFAIAGKDRRFHPADVVYAEQGKDDRGQIQYNRRQLVLTSPMVSQPIHFRYGWGRNPLANLQATGNKDLPFATQRSDDWPMEQVPLGVLGEQVNLPLPGGDRNKIVQALREQDRQRRLKEAQRILDSNGDAPQTDD